MRPLTSQPVDPALMSQPKARRHPARSLLGTSVVCALLATALSTISPDPASAQTLTCQGRTATIVGTGGADTINGTSGDDVIIGGPGADRIFGLGGNDVICGGLGSNLIEGGTGDDVIIGGPVRDVLRGDAGADIIRGGNGNDHIRGDDGFDRLFGGNGHDYAYGGDGVDWVNGGDGADLIIGGVGDDVLAGNNGNDRVYGGTEADRMFGGTGNDLLNGGPGNDIGWGNEGGDRLIGWTGDDRLGGGTGNDRIGGGDGADLIAGGPGTDVLDGGAQTDDCIDTDADTVLRLCEVDPPTGETTRIMPLGDSITAGVTADSSVPRIATESYRPALWRSLTNRNCNVDFVGSQFGTDSGPFPDTSIDPNHEGYSGWTSQSIRYNTRAWAQAAQPDVVMLMIGTNDIMQWFETAASAVHIAAIVAELRAVNPSVVVLIGEVPPLDEVLTNARPNGVQDLNAALVAVVAQINTAASPVQLVQMFDELDINLHYQDGIHPDFRGEPIMAAQWEQSLLPHIPSC